MLSKRSHEGYLLINHKDSPGLTDSELIIGGSMLPPGAGRGVFEAPIITCSHCETGLIVNPLRTRDRAYCPKCDHYICDKCEIVRVQTGVCKTYKQFIDELQEADQKKEIVNG
jgi:hypothetical protein